MGPAPLRQAQPLPEPTTMVGQPAVTILIRVATNHVSAKSERDVGARFCLSGTTKQASNSSTDHGGGKRRADGIELN